MKRKVTKKIAIVILWILGIFIALDLILVTLIFIPPVQNALVRKVTGMLSDNWQTQLSIDRIYLNPALKLVIDGFVIKDHHNNDMIRVDKAKTRIRNVQFSPLKLSFGDLQFNGADVTLRKYAGDESLNISVWTQKMKNEEPKPLVLRADRLTLRKSRFTLINDETRVNHGDDSKMDYAFFQLNDIDFYSRDFNIDGDDISAKITKLAFDQYTGFSLKEATADFRINGRNLFFNNARLVTPQSILYMDLAFYYDTWKSYGSFLDSVSIVADIRPSILDMDDVAAFAPAIDGMREKIVIAGNIRGPVNNLDIKNFLVRYGRKTSFAGDLQLANITDIRNVYMDLDIDNAAVNFEELTHFTLPRGNTITLPEQVMNISNANVSGFYSGQLTHFETQLKVHTDAGNAMVDFKVDEVGKRLQYRGKISTPGFNLARVLDEYKYMGVVAGGVGIKGTAGSPRYGEKLLASAKAALNGNISRFDLLGYPLHDVAINGNIDGKVYSAQVVSADTNINFRFTGIMDLTTPVPNFKSYASFDRFAPGNIVRYLPEVDSASAQGIDKAILFVRQNPSIEISFDSLELMVNGRRIDGINGFFGVDGITYKIEDKRVDGERIRLTAINTASGLHKFILTSGIVNATLTTNYKLDGIIDSLLLVGYRYFPNLFPAYHDNIAVNEENVLPDKETYFRLNVETFQTRDILSIFVPGLRIAPSSTCNIYLSSDRNDTLEINSRRIRYKDIVQVHNLNVRGREAVDTAFQLTLRTDSILIPQKKNNIVFTHLALGSAFVNNQIYYGFQWRNPASISDGISYLSGIVDANNKDDIQLRIARSLIDIKNIRWQFNRDHLVHFRSDHIDFDNVILESGISRLSVDGVFSFQKNDDLNVNITNVDLSPFNTFAENINLSFGGDISAKVRLSSWNNKRMVTGKLLVSDFMFNEEYFGNLFLSAAAPGGASIGFSGGLFSRERTLNSAIIENYNLRNYNDEALKLANLSGFYHVDKRSLDIKANIDTLRIGFLSPFLASFSHEVSGYASGEISFIANPDSTYFDGKVTVHNGELGIKPLNTVYSLNNQEIYFNQKGIEFPDIILSDIHGNRGRLTGYVHHQKFKNFELDLAIATDRLLVLNSPKQTDSPFYGTGFVSGNVSIIGNTENLSFRGNNLITLPGTKLFLPVTFSERVFESEGIRFKVDQSQRAARKNQDSENTSTALDFDFVFQLNKDAEVQLDLDPSIGGSLTARADGILQLSYQDEAGLNLAGILSIVSGKFAMSLRDVLLNAKFDIVPGGTIHFNGPVDDSEIDAQALYKTTAPLNEIIPEASTRRAPVNAYINLSGSLMTPSIGFSFELPNASAEDNARLNIAIDASNEGSAARQFFSLFLMSKFTVDNDLTRDQITTIGTDAGSEMLSNVVSNFLSQQFKYGELGFNMRNMGRENEQEYSINASIPVWNDRIILQTNLGYAEGSTEENYNNFIGDFSIEFLLNEPGNWRLKAFVSNDEYLVSDYIGQRNNGAAGVALVYKQEFNNGKDILDSFRRKNKKKAKKSAKRDNIIEP